MELLCLPQYKPLLRRDTIDRSNGNINLTKYQNGAIGSIKKISADKQAFKEQTSDYRTRKFAQKNIYRNKQEYSECLPAEDHLFYRAFRHVVNTSSRFSSHDYISFPLICICQLYAVKQCLQQRLQE